jgi:phosphoglycolate phosphatase-like HAD superfamily hydrolase
VVVGDSPADLAMGRAAGAHTIQVLWGYARTPLPDADLSVRTWRALRDAVFALAGPKRPYSVGSGPVRS